LGLAGDSGKTSVLTSHDEQGKPIDEPRSPSVSFRPSRSVNVLDMGTEWKASSDAKDGFEVAAWNKVMNLDRFDLV